MFEYYKFMELDELYTRGRLEEAKALLLDIQSKYINTCDENAIIRIRLRELEDLIFLSRNLIFDGVNYWLTNESFKQGPYCKVCYDKNSTLVPLESKNGEWHCKACAREFLIQNKDILEIKSANIIPFSKAAN